MDARPLLAALLLSSGLLAAAPAARATAGVCLPVADYACFGAGSDGDGDCRTSGHSAAGLTGSVLERGASLGYGVGYSCSASCCSSRFTDVIVSAGGCAKGECASAMVFWGGGTSVPCREEVFAGSTPTGYQDGTFICPRGAPPPENLPTLP